MASDESELFVIRIRQLIGREIRIYIYEWKWFYNSRIPIGVLWYNYVP